MSQMGTVMVGNDFIAPAAKLRVVGEVNVPVIPVEVISQLDIVPVTVSVTRVPIEVIHRHSLVVFALLFLLVGASGIEVGASYWSARLLKPVAAISLSQHSIAGLNLTVPVSQLQTKMQSITGQSASLTIGSQKVSISPDTIKSWLKVTPNAAKTEDYVHLNSQAMAQSINDLADKYAVTPVNQVSVTHDGNSEVIIAGQNGAKLSDPAGLTNQAHNLAKSVMNGGGLNLSAPLVNQPFQAVTAASFSKLIEVDVNTHQMYLYDNGNLTSTYAISAGAPATPTPIGEFHIWEKLTEQTMRGFNPNGTPYVQPNVQWINYFDHSGDAVHGNYWRPLSVFGAVNTSHGCVSLPDNEAEVVYNWAPIGTTVITHD